MQIAGVPISSVDKNSGKLRVNGYGTCGSRLVIQCRERNYVSSSDRYRKPFRLSSLHHKPSLRRMVCGNRQKMWDDHMVISGQVTFPMPRK